MIVTPLTVKRLLIVGARTQWSRQTAKALFSTQLKVNGLQKPFQDECPSESSNSTVQASASKSSASSLLQGHVLDYSVDLRSVRPGDRLDIPYELTITDALQEFWFASFFDQSRIHTSTPFCRKMGLQDRVLPFSLSLFLTSSMSHADAAKVQVGFGKVSYLWPLFAGDTVRKTFTVNQVRNTSDGNHSVIYFTCDLINQRDRLCMRADKRMLFQFPVSGSNDSPWHDKDSVNTHMFRDHLLSKATTVLAHSPSHSLTRLDPGQLILHSLHRSLTFSQSQQLASLVRLTHERHFNTKKYDRHSEILIPGGLVLGLVHSACARDLHEVLHEEIQSCSYVNALHPDQMVGAVSYISGIDDNLPGDLQVASMTTLGIKNLNVRDLDGVGIPLELFAPGIFSKEIEQICKELCPVLSNNIVMQVSKKILRQTNHREVFLL
jgi:acyl dehydratase